MAPRPKQRSPIAALETSPAKTSRWLTDCDDSVRFGELFTCNIEPLSEADDTAFDNGPRCETLSLESRETWHTMCGRMV